MHIQVIPDGEWHEDPRNLTVSDDDSRPGEYPGNTVDMELGTQFVWLN